MRETSWKLFPDRSEEGSFKIKKKQIKILEYQASMKQENIWVKIWANITFLLQAHLTGKAFSETGIINLNLI
jgi:hypothetical protein